MFYAESIMTLSIMTLSQTALSIITLSQTALSITAVSSKNGKTQHNYVRC
jgi:hypothetical protein